MAQQNNNKRKRIWSLIKNLPAYHARKSFLQALASSEVVLVVGETGCGKTTQVGFLYYVSFITY